MFNSNQNYLLPNFSKYLPSQAKYQSIEQPTFEELVYNKSGSRRSILSTSTKFSKGEYLTTGVYLDPSFDFTICMLSVKIIEGLSIWMREFFLMLHWIDSRFQSIS